MNLREKVEAALRGEGLIWSLDQVDAILALIESEKAAAWDEGVEQVTRQRIWGDHLAKLNPYRSQP